MLVTQSMMMEESDMIRDRFPFEAEREEDGSLIIGYILGRRLRLSGRRWVRSGSSQLSASDAKFDYEYLIKFKVRTTLYHRQSTYFYFNHNICVLYIHAGHVLYARAVAISHRHRGYEPSQQEGSHPLPQQTR